MTEVISSPMLSSLGFVRFAMSTRKGGASAEPYGMNLSYKVGDARENVLANRSKLFEHLGIQQERLALPKQCHSARVVKVDTGGEYESCDGLATATPGIWLGISIADCLPVVLADPKCKAVAVLHAGWRGTMQGIVRNGVAALSDAFESKPEDMVAFLGPSASACCYEVGVEVAERFSASVLQRRNNEIFP